MSSPMPVNPIRLYGFPLSGHAHRVQLFLSLLNLPFEVVEIDLPKRQQKTPEFLALNALGQVPVIQDGGFTLADSNAILVYLAGKYADPSWLPREPEAGATVQRFLSIAAGEIAKGPAVARLIYLFKAPMDLVAAQGIAQRLFSVFEEYLTTRDFLAATHPTIADIACYTYIAHAPEGGIPLDDFPHIRAWLARIEALPGFVAMRASPLPV